MDLSKIKLTRYIIIGMISGLILGAVLGRFVEFQVDESGQRMLDSNNRPMLESGVVADYVVDGFLEIIGSIFIRSLKMLVVPLSLIHI